jgi:PAS domain S-box-containing protein
MARQDNNQNKISIPLDSRLDPSEMHRQAEKKANSMEIMELECQSPEMQHMVHELQVHQIELEMQNDVLKRARDEVEAGYAKFTDIYDFAPVGYFNLSRDTAILKVNLAGASLMGFERQRLLGKPFNSLITPQSLPAFNALFDRVFTGYEKQTCEISLLKEGETLTLRIEAVAVGSGRECLVIVIDITENRRMENLVRVRMHLMEYAQGHTLEDVLRETLDNVGNLVNSPVGFYHFVAEDEKNILLQTWSTRTLKEFCKAKGQGLHYSMDKGGVWVDCVRLRRPVIHNDYASLPNKKGMPDGHAELIRELVVPIMRGGKIVAILGVGNKPTDYTDKDVEIVSFIADVAWTVAERKQMEEALNRSEAHFKLLSETAERLIMWKDVQPVINDLCKETMDHLDCQVFFNYLVDEKAGRLHLNASTGISEEDVSKIEWLDHEVLTVCGCSRDEGGAIFRDPVCPISDPEIGLVRSYGILAQACHPLMIQGKIIGTLSFGTKTRSSFSQDDLVLMKRVAAQVAGAMERSRLINEIQQAREDLELRVQERTADLVKINETLIRSNTALEDFAHVAAHDLQEPLRKIKTFADMIVANKQNSLNEQGRDHLTRMQKSTTRMQALIHDLFKYSRVASSQENLKVFNLKRVVEEAVKDLSLVLKESEGRIIIEGLPDVEANENLMRQLFQNLIGNGLKYRNNRKPVIRISSPSSGNGFHEIFVEDNGIGFNEIFLDRIFKPFQRLHGRTSPYEGTGMGLAICLKILELHGGSITAKSVPDKGSTFIVRLPEKKRG